MNDRVGTFVLDFCIAEISNNFLLKISVKEITYFKQSKKKVNFQPSSSEILFLSTILNSCFFLKFLKEAGLYL